MLEKGIKGTGHQVVTEKLTAKEMGSGELASSVCTARRYPLSSALSFPRSFILLLYSDSILYTHDEEDVKKLRANVLFVDNKAGSCYNNV